MWSLAVEEQFYLVLPWVVLLFGPRYLVPVLLATVAASALSKPPFLNPAPVWQFATSWNVGALAVGVLFALLQPRLKPVHSARLAISGLGFLALSFLLPAATPVEDLLAIGAACCASACVCSTRVWPRLVNFPAAIGQASYEIYLLHPAVLFAAAPILQGRSLARGWFLFAATTAVLGCAVHRGFSEPANLWLRAELTPRVATYAVPS